MNFESPLLLFLAGPWAVLLWFLAWRQERAARALASAVSPRFLPALTLLTTGKRRLFYDAWLFLGGALLIAAAARPVALTRASIRGESVRPVLVVLDGSLSMLAEDTVPVEPGPAPDGSYRADLKEKNRMLLAARVAQSVMDSFPKSSFALVSYSGLAVAHSPFTRDRGALRQVLSHFEDHWYEQTGTDFRSGLDMVLRLSSRRGGAHMQVLWLSDGEEEQGRDFSAEVSTLARLGIPIHTVALGSRKGAKVRVKRPEDLLSHKAKAHTVTFTTKKETKGLAKISAATGGSFFDLGDKPNLVPILNALRGSTYTANMGDRKAPGDVSWLVLFGFGLWWLIDFFFFDSLPLRFHRRPGAKGFTA